MKRQILIALTLFIACTGAPVDHEAHRKAANELTQRYGQSKLTGWTVRGQAAGQDCGVLLVKASIILDDSMIEAMHYGTGAYDIIEGGVQSFSREHAFRAVAYRDASPRVWTYGTLAQDEANKLPPCR